MVTHWTRGEWCKKTERTEMNESITTSASAWSGSIAPAGTTQKPEIEMVLDGLEKEIRQLEENIKGLGARLIVVSLPVADRDKGVNPVSPPHSAMYMHVDAMRVKLTALNTELADIKQRLEV